MSEEKEIRARYLLRDRTFEFAGIAEDNVFLPEDSISTIVESLKKNDGPKGQAEAEIVKFLVTEAKKRAKELTQKGERDGEKYWVSATSKPATPGQALVGPGGEA